MARSISISEARAQLPALAKYLRRAPHRVVFIEHRDLQERLALVTEGRLRYLEALVEAASQQRQATFKLAGSISSELPDDELERELRAIKKEELERSQAKLDKL